jgi:anthranilate synthase/indole-3-glycerol phosphate synthase/phosphoribosylanthranilate isomerase
MAIEAGADMIGIILLPGVKRHISTEVAQEIAQVVRQARSSSSTTSPSSSSSSVNSAEPTSWFSHHATRLSSRRKPLLVGVFRNQPLSDILDLIDSIPLDIVQLHGTEPQSYAKFIPVPTIKTFSVSSSGTITGGQITRPGLNEFILLDAASAGGESGGGEGKSFPWEYAKKVIDGGEIHGDGRLPVVLAGGLGPDNVAEAIRQAGSVVGVDVSSGVEGEGGMKDAEKVKAFIKAVKGE